VELLEEDDEMSNNIYIHTNSHHSSHPHHQGHQNNNIHTDNNNLWTIRKLAGITLDYISVTYPFIYLLLYLLLNHYFNLVILYTERVVA
jgi:hypothetical protein